MLGQCWPHDGTNVGPLTSQYWPALQKLPGPISAANIGPVSLAIIGPILARDTNADWVAVAVFGRCKDGRAPVPGCTPKSSVNVLCDAETTIVTLS